MLVRFFAQQIDLDTERRVVLGTGVEQSGGKRRFAIDSGPHGPTTDARDSDLGTSDDHFTQMEAFLAHGFAYLHHHHSDLRWADDVELIRDVASRQK